MTQLSRFFACCMLVLASSAIARGDDFADLRRIVDACEGQGLRALSGLCCNASTKYYDSAGDLLRESHARGAFRAANQWGVWIGDEPDAWSAAVVQNGELAFTINYPDTSQATMPEYGFGPEVRQRNEFSAQKFVASMTAGSHFRDKTLSFILRRTSFEARRATGRDSEELGSCWEWTITEDDEMPPCSGAMWLREFPDGGASLGKFVIAYGDGPPSTIVNHFSEDPAHPGLIDEVVISDSGGRSVFRIHSLSPENEAPDGFRPERFGFATPVNTARRRFYLLTAALVAGLVAVVLSVWRYRRRS